MTLPPPLPLFVPPDDQNLTSQALSDRLVDACLHGNAVTARRYLSLGATPWSVSPIAEGKAAWIVAIERDANVLLPLMIEAGLPPETIYSDAPLLVAVMSLAQRPLLDALMRAGAEINGQDRRGRGIVSLSLDNADLEITRWALDQAPEQVHDRIAITRETVLHQVVERDVDDSERIHLLLNAGADPFTQREDGRTPMDLAREHGHVRTIAVLERRCLDAVLTPSHVQPIPVRPRSRL